MNELLRLAAAPSLEAPLTDADISWMADRFSLKAAFGDTEGDVEWVFDPLALRQFVDALLEMPAMTVAESEMRNALSRVINAGVRIVKSAPPGGEPEWEVSDEAVIAFEALSVLGDEPATRKSEIARALLEARK